MFCRITGKEVSAYRMTEEPKESYGEINMENENNTSQQEHDRKVVRPVVGSADDFREPKTKLWITLAVAACAAVALFLIYWFVIRGRISGHSELHEDPMGLAGGALEVSETEDTPAAGDTGSENAGVYYETESEAEITFNPHPVESTMPSNMIEFTGIEMNGEELADIQNYKSPSEFYFDKGSEYTQAEGIFTFRGNNFRDAPAVGYADITKNTISQEWSQQTGATSYNGASWTGSGWTGQPLMRKWTREEKAHMNMEDWAKEKDDLVEVIYATMDGYVYFLDLVTGEHTREPMYIGWTFKGAGA